MPRFSLMYRFVIAILRLPLSIWTKRDWRGTENLPKVGGFIVAANHITELDPLTFMHFLVDQKIPVRVMVKSSLFKVPVLSKVLRATGQVPVFRGTQRAVDALQAAVISLRAGEIIGLFPEGTLTDDPDGWPIKAKSGVGRLALETRVPVIPVAQWGAHNLLKPGSKKPNLLRRHKVTVVAGPAVDLSDLYDLEDRHAAAIEATSRIMTTIAQQLVEIRDEELPADNPYSAKNQEEPPQ